jgi:S1-C subfamily serine protease
VRAISQKRVGDTISLTVYRKGAALNIPVKLLRPPEAG